MAGRLLLIALCAFLVDWPEAGGADNRANPPSAKIMGRDCVTLAQPTGGNRPCPGSDDAWEGDAAARSPGCVQFGQTHAGDAVLVNPCAVCRAVAIETIDLVGNLSRRSYAVAPRSSIGLPTDGLARARIVRDDPCG